MKKKIFLLTISLFIIMLPNIILAFDPNISDPNPTIDSDLGEMVKTLLGAIQWVGYAIAIGMLIYIGIKYTMVSANEKANMKQASINYVIGAIIIAGVVTLFDWCVTFFVDAKNGGDNAGGAGSGYSEDAGDGVIGGFDTPEII